MQYLHARGCSTGPSPMAKLHADQPAHISQQYLLNAPLLSNKQGFSQQLLCELSPTDCRKAVLRHTNWLKKAGNECRAEDQSSAFRAPAFRALRKLLGVVVDGQPIVNRRKLWRLSSAQVAVKSVVNRRKLWQLSSSQVAVQTSFQ